MKSQIFYYFILSFMLVLTGCELDNYEAPTSTLKGNVVYNGQPLNVRSNGVKLELWQYGHELLTKIPVNVDQDGSFSASLFDGDYKLTRLRGAPWVDNTDTIDIKVRGSAIVDVPVEPFFIINNASFQRSGTTGVTATFNLQQINASRPLELARVYVGQTMIVDQTNNAASNTIAADAIPDLSQPVITTVTIPATMAGREFVFARVGVKVQGVAELLYSAPQKIMLK